MDWRALGPLAIPVAATLVGGASSAFFRPKGKLKSHAQHFAAGIVLAAVAVAVEVIPELERAHGAMGPLFAAFAVGGAAMFLVKWLEHRREHIERRPSPLGFIIAAAADILVDGLVIGAGIAKAPSTGLLLSVGLAIELLFLGMSITSELGDAKWKPVVTTAGLAIVLALGAVVGVTALRALPVVWTNVALSFGSAAMLYLVTEELLVEAHESGDTPTAVASTFAGFLCFWALEVTL